jgi:hypothetical protein
MFRGLINDAKSAVGNLVLKYVARASVAVPFGIAVGFLPLQQSPPWSSNGLAR